ncbi:hypothetical protein [Rhodovulum sulfidophilum]|uniref:hypothetical protein n=1 Tax=Rhodovulum sulfidophilum TaxID=35806 RepID=UPI001923845F|nr:hypothetical protein [Rhodovulum sulfidophilum]MBL3560416.1 hypothetical protein [Rhodovulum sulfidophilum]
MTDREGLLSGTFGLVLTDLFLAATATILMLLAVLREAPDIPIPIQADLQMSCVVDGGFVLSRLDRDDPMISVTEAAQLGPAVAALDIRPRLFQTVALVPGPDGLSANCLAQAQKIIRSWNASLGDIAVAEGNATVLGLAAVPHAQSGSWP